MCVFQSYTFYTIICFHIVNQERKIFQVGFSEKLTVNSIYVLQIPFHLGMVPNIYERLSLIQRPPIKLSLKKGQSVSLVSSTVFFLNSLPVSCYYRFLV